MHIIRNEKVLTYIDYQPVYKGLNVAEFGEETNDRTSFNSVLCYRHNHIVHFVLKGNGKFHCDGKTYPLTAGKAFVITPENLIRYEADENTEWTYCWLSFAGIDCSNLFQQCGFTKEAVVFDFTPEDIRRLQEYLEYIRKESPTDEAVFSLAVNSMAFEVLKNCASKLRAELPKSQVLSTSIIDTAITYMQNNLHKPMNISTLCKELNISRTYFSTLFEATMKHPPYQYLQNLRIQRAGELLLNDKNLRIYEVAEMVGFSSIAQFCKTFRKTLNCRPSEFRDKYLEKKE